MKPSEVREVRREAAAAGEWSGIGWTDSSWELMHGLDVVEDLPAEAWPPELAPPALQGALVASAEFKRR
ncbi:MAG: hypothetical protein KF891_12365 [Rhizobacter sp.]|nr:hypothetical protein [Rhizobacter sp.]